MANAHAITMVGVTVLVLANIALRIFVFPDDAYAGVGSSDGDTDETSRPHSTAITR